MNHPLPRVVGRRCGDQDVLDRLEDVDVADPGEAGVPITIRAVQVMTTMALFASSVSTPLWEDSRLSDNWTAESLLSIDTTNVIEHGIRWRQYRRGVRTSPSLSPGMSPPI